MSDYFDDEYPELDFSEKLTDDVPVFDRGKVRDISSDSTVPVPLPRVSSLRTCPVCRRMFSLKDIEIGCLDEYGDRVVFFCSDEHKQVWQNRT